MVLCDHNFSYPDRLVNFLLKQLLSVILYYLRFLSTGTAYGISTGWYLYRFPHKTWETNSLNVLLVMYKLLPSEPDVFFTSQARAWESRDTSNILLAQVFS